MTIYTKLFKKVQEDRSVEILEDNRGKSKIISTKFQSRNLQDVNSIESNIPLEYRRKTSIDFDFKKQRLPFLLGGEYKVNEVESLDAFLKNDKEIIRNYLALNSYPNLCMHVNNYARIKMQKTGLSVALINGEVSKGDFDSNFHYDYLLDREEFNDDFPSTIHWYVVGKFSKKGIINEVIIDYAADQFSKGSIVPVIGTRDALRSLYVIVGNAHPSIESSFIKQGI